MRKVILSLAVSLDGFIEGPNGEYDWCFTDQDYGMSEFFSGVDAVFLGRKSYELMQGMDSAGMDLPKMEEYVFSNTLTTVKEGYHLISGDISKAVHEIKIKPGKNIWMFGGAELTKSLMNLKLIDEIHLAVHPLLLGAGKHLFKDIPERIQLKLFDQKTYSSGLVILKYQIL